MYSFHTRIRKERNSSKEPNSSSEDSSSDDEPEVKYPEPILRAQSSQFVVTRTHFDVKITESRQIRGIIGTCMFVRDEGKFRYAFSWGSGMNYRYHEEFGWDYPTESVIFNIGKKIALQNGFTSSEFEKCQGCP